MLFDLSKVEIIRKRFSVTQGETLVKYDGKSLGQYGDTPILCTDGQYRQRPDAEWIDFARICVTMPWNVWEVEDLSQPVDFTFCTRDTPARPLYRTDLTRAGEQYVIPGCEVDAPQASTRQMSLF